MAFSQTHAQPSIPQEIIDLIIDELANQKPALETRTALRACSLVSKSFTYRARRQLWCNIVFYVDGTLAKRINKFVRMLKRMNDKTLISEVHSFKLVFEDPGTRQKNPDIPGQMAVLRSILRFFERQYDIFDVFSMLKNPNLRHLSVASRGGIPFYWGQGAISIQPPLLQILSSSNLKSFALCNISAVSKMIVAAAFFSKTIQELTLRNTFLGHRDETPLTNEVYGVLADLRRLEMTGVSLSSVFSLILGILPNSTIRQPLFPHLQTLVISVPWNTDHTSVLWKYVLGSASTLKTLEMEFHYRHHYYESQISSLNHLSLSGLVSLRHFKFRTASPDSIAWIEDCQRALLDIFAIRDFSNKLESIELQFLLSAMWDHINGATLERYKQAQYWDVIDLLFISEGFTNLELLKISIEVRHYPNPRDTTHCIPTEELYDFANTMLRRVTEAPQIQLTLDGRLVFCNNPGLYGNPDCQASKSFAKHITASDAGL